MIFPGNSTSIDLSSSIDIICDMSALTAVILTRNEQETITTAISSVAFCDEILVIDDGSTDETIDRARASGAQVIEHELNGDFAQQRTFGMQQARNYWVLFLDADEEVSPALAEEIQSHIGTSTAEDSSQSNHAFRIPRVDLWCNRTLRHGELATAARSGFVRLIDRRGSGLWQGSVHETYRTDGPVGQLTQHLVHRPHQTVAAFLASVNHYSTLRAQELYSQHHRFTLFEALAFPLGKFLATYVWQMGFRDGTPGFIYSFMMSFHSFLVRAKLFQYHNLHNSY